MEDDVRIGPSPARHIRQRPPHGKPGTLLVGQESGGLCQREVSFGLRELIRKPMAQIEQRTGVVLADRTDPPTPAIRSSRASGSGDW